MRSAATRTPARAKRYRTLTSVAIFLRCLSTPWKSHLDGRSQGSTHSRGHLRLFGRNRPCHSEVMYCTLGHVDYAAFRCACSVAARGATVDFRQFQVLVINAVATAQLATTHPVLSKDTGAACFDSCAGLMDPGCMRMAHTAFFYNAFPAISILRLPPTKHQLFAQRRLEPFSSRLTAPRSWLGVVLGDGAEKKRQKQAKQTLACSNEVVDNTLRWWGDGDAVASLEIRCK